jgi:tryptophan synthase beta chain
MPDYFRHHPDSKGFFGEHGGAFLPPELEDHFREITEAYLLQDDDGNPAPVYSIASGLDYPGVGPEHAYFKDTGRIQYETASDEECLDAFFTLSRTEGIIPALESAHAIAFAMRWAREHRFSSILVNLSGRGDKDLDFVTEKYGFGEDRK